MEVKFENNLFRQIQLKTFFFIFRLTTVGCHPVCLAGVQQAGAGPGPGLLELQLPEVEEEERKQQQGTYEQVA